tara:strand:- start:383 stop:688 length:306 start_codon:yes stop_codon:yes gene_type:complete
MATIANQSGHLVYDPRGVIEADHLLSAKGVSGIQGLKLGVLDNTKWNGRLLLEKIISQIDADGVLAEVNYYKKDSFSKIASAELIDQIATQNNVVVTAIGD